MGGQRKGEGEREEERDDTYTHECHPLLSRTVTCTFTAVPAKAFSHVGRLHRTFVRRL